MGGSIKGLSGLSVSGGPGSITSAISSLPRSRAGTGGQGKQAEETNTYRLYLHFCYRFRSVKSEGSVSLHHDPRPRRSTQPRPAQLKRGVLGIDLLGHRQQRGQVGEPDSQLKQLPRHNYQGIHDQGRDQRGQPRGPGTALEWTTAATTTNEENARRSQGTITLQER